MALRVLLADESHTIKKVFQLALQDYAVEVRPVNIGLDVLPVAKKLNPDIIFADVLLQKKSGYDVCAEIKNSPELAGIPVVLMWSGFLDLDEDKFQASKADARLEKPFDVNALRTIVQQLVPKTKTQKLSGFLSFPDRPEFDVAPMVPPTKADPVVDTEKSLWNMESFDPIEAPQLPDSGDEFQPVTLTKPQAVEDQDVALISKDPEENRTGWTQKSLGQFRIHIDEDSTDSDLPVDYVVPEEPLDVPRGMQKPAETEAPPKILQWDHEPAKANDGAYVIDQPSQVFEYSGPSQVGVPTPPPLPTAKSSDASSVRAETSSKIDQKTLEKMVEERAQAIIEEIVWKVVPELASRIIERELQKLLSENELR